MKAFHGDPQIKADLLAQIAAHRAADEIVQVFWDGSIFWDGSCGSAVGCMTHDPDGGHEQFPELWGIPEELALLVDSIHESLRPALAKDWPHRFISAIPVGAELEPVITRISIWLLADPTYGTMGFCNEAVLDVAERAVALLRRRLVGDEPTRDEWQEVRIDSCVSADEYGHSCKEVVVVRRAAHDSPGRVADAAFEAALEHGVEGPLSRALADELVRLCESAA